MKKSELFDLVWENTIRADEAVDPALSQALKNKIRNAQIPIEQYTRIVNIIDLYKCELKFTNAMTLTETLSAFLEVENDVDMFDKDWIATQLRQLGGVWNQKPLEVFPPFD